MPPIGVVPKAEGVRNELDAFQLFITPDMIKSNRKINIVQKLPIEFNKDFKYPYVRTTDDLEMTAFIGLILYRG